MQNEENARDRHRLKQLGKLRDFFGHSFLLLLACQFLISACHVTHLQRADCSTFPA